MGNRQQTMAKIARERSVKERRERKEEKKRLKKLAAAEQTDLTSEETDLTAEAGDLPNGETDPAPPPTDGETEIPDESTG